MSAAWAAVAVCVVIAVVDPVAWVRQRRARRAACLPDADLPPAELRRRLNAEVHEVLVDKPIEVSRLEVRVTSAWRRANRAPRAEA